MTCSTAGGTVHSVVARDFPPTEESAAGSGDVSRYPGPRFAANRPYVSVCDPDSKPDLMSIVNYKEF